MEAQVIAIFESMLNGDTKPSIALLSVIILSLFGIYKYILTNIKTTVETIDTQNQIELKSMVDITDKLDTLLKRLDALEVHCQIDSKNTDELKRDLEQIKQILNQFQGHMLYGRKSDDFGNRELK